MTDTIFQPFASDGSIELLDVDHVRRVLRYRRHDTGATGWAPYPGLDVAASSMGAGRAIRVRWGRMAAAHADRLRATRFRQGDVGIVAIAHPRPTLTTLSLAVMRWTLGDERCAEQMREWSRCASTDQTQASYAALDGSTVMLDLAGGCIRAGARLGRATTSTHGIALDMDVPDSVLAGIAGRRIDEVLDHPGLRHAGTIATATATATQGGGAYLHLAPSILGVDDALRMIGGDRLDRAA